MTGALKEVECVLRSLHPEALLFLGARHRASLMLTLKESDTEAKYQTQGCLSTVGGVTARQQIHIKCT